MLLIKSWGEERSLGAASRVSLGSVEETECDVTETVLPLAGLEPPPRSEIMGLTGFVKQVTAVAG